MCQEAHVCLEYISTFLTGETFCYILGLRFCVLFLLYLCQISVVVSEAGVVVSIALLVVVIVVLAVTVEMVVASSISRGDVVMVVILQNQLLFLDIGVSQSGKKVQGPEINKMIGQSVPEPYLHTSTQIGQSVPEPHLHTDRTVRA